MEDDTLAFLSGGTEDTAAAPSPQPPPAPEAVGETAPPPAAPRTPEPGHVPLSAVLDERERRQAAEARLAEYEAVQREAVAQAQQAELPPAERVEQALYAQNLRASRRFAEREYGKAAIGALHDWAVARCDADPFFNQQMVRFRSNSGLAWEAETGKPCRLSAPAWGRSRAWRRGALGSEPVRHDAALRWTRKRRRSSTDANQCGPAVAPGGLVSPTGAKPAVGWRCQGRRCL